MKEFSNRGRLDLRQVDNSPRYQAVAPIRRRSRSKANGSARFIVAPITRIETSPTHGLSPELPHFSVPYSRNGGTTMPRLPSLALASLPIGSTAHDMGDGK